MSALSAATMKSNWGIWVVYNAGGVDPGWLCGPKRTYDPRARLVSRALERIDGANTGANSSAKGARVLACPRRVRDRRPWSGPRTVALVARHWACSNAFWLSRFRRVVRDFKRHAGTVAAFVPLAQVRIMLQRLTASSSS